MTRHQWETNIPHIILYIWWLRTFQRTFQRLASVSAHFDSSSPLLITSSRTHLWASRTQAVKQVCSEDIGSVPGNHSYPSIANMGASMKHVNRSIEPKTNLQLNFSLAGVSNMLRTFPSPQNSSIQVESVEGGGPVRGDYIFSLLKLYIFLLQFYQKHDHVNPCKP